MKKDSNFGMTATYEDFEPTLNRLVSRFYYQRRSIFQKIGKSKTDVFGTALELFIKAYLTHDSEKGSFEARARYVIWNGMLDRFHVDFTEARHRQSSNPGSQEPFDLSLFYVRKTSKFNLKRFRQSLSLPAQRAMNLAIYPPDEIKERAEEAGGSGRNYCAAIRKYLIKKDGLTPHQVKECFQEIANRLREISE